MGIRRFGGQGVEKRDLDDDALDGGVKRNASGTIQFTKAGSTSTTGTTGSNTVTLTTTGRHVADKLKVKVTEASAGTLAWTLSRNGSSVTAKTGVTATTTLTTTNTFAAATNQTWQVKLNPAAGSWKLTTFTASVEDVRS